MKALLIYTSIHQGNTESIAKVMANILNALLFQVEQAPMSILEQYDLISNWTLTSS